MSSSSILKAFGGLIMVIILLYSFLPGENVSYHQTVVQHREELNDFMKNHRESPLPDSLKQNFTGLNFFEPNPEFKVEAALETIPGTPTLVMATSDGETRQYERFAYAFFELGGKQNRLTLFKVVDDGQESLFLPFGDTSNGEETYGGGRYLDLELTTKDRIAIDFNLAYNPYCVYSTNFSCPLPPAENQLAIAIPAGEKNFNPGP